jgi:hypothetical protein
MSSITVTTQAGIHSGKHNNPVESPANTDPTTWIIVGAISLIILIRGAIKTFK